MLHPIWISSGASDWQVLPRKDRFALAEITGGRDPQRAPAAVFLRCVSERDGSLVCPWQQAQTVDETRWRVILQIPTGGPYRLESCAKLPEQSFADAVGGDMRQHVFAGDLYLIAGQSNAAGYARDAVPDAPCLGVSVLRLNGRWDLAAHPLNDGTDMIRDNLEVPIPAHSPWLSFGRTLYRHTGVPVGLIPAALGGSPIHSWLSGGMLYENAKSIAREAGPLTGVLWYQGCSDALAYDTENYGTRFRQTVTSFRRDLNLENLPFFTCQLNGFADRGTREDDMAWAALRRAQELEALQKNVYMLPTAGLELYDQIHNNARSNMLIGRQMAMQVLGALYDGKRRCVPPAVAAVETAENRLILTLSPVEGVLKAKRTAKDAFRATRGTAPMAITALRIEGEKLILEGPGLQFAERLSYAQSRDLTGAGIYDKRGHWMLAPFQISIKKERG